MYGHKKKKRERVETEKEYVDLIKHSRKPPFEIVNVSQFDMKDYEQLFAKDEDLQKNTIKIAKVVKIVYKVELEADIKKKKNKHKGVKKETRC